MSIENQLRQYIVDNFLYSADAEELADDLALFDEGVIDSTGVLELIAFLEEAFEVQVDDAEILPENFESIKALAAFVRSKQ